MEKRNEMLILLLFKTTLEKKKRREKQEKVQFAEAKRHVWEENLNKGIKRKL